MLQYRSLAHRTPRTTHIRVVYSTISNKKFSNKLHKLVELRIPCIHCNLTGQKFNILLYGRDPKVYIPEMDVYTKVYGVSAYIGLRWREMREKKEREGLSKKKGFFRADYAAIQCSAPSPPIGHGERRGLGRPSARARRDGDGVCAGLRRWRA